MKNLILIVIASMSFGASAQQVEKKVIYSNVSQSFYELIENNDTLFVFQFKDNSYSYITVLEQVQFNSKSEAIDFFNTCKMSTPDLSILGNCSIYRASAKWVTVIVGKSYTNLKVSAIDEILKLIQ